MKIVADADILSVERFAAVGELVLKPGRLLARDDCRDADLLLVRSVTRVDARLLADTKVKWVGSAAAGSDHLDTAWLDAAGIRFQLALGANARAVAEYVVAVVANLYQQGIFTPERSLRAGIIGVGRTGRWVEHHLKALGFDVSVCDPLRAAEESHFPHQPFTAWEDLDLITVHTPLTYTGPYPTYHMLDHSFFKRQKPGAVLLNAGRGEVIHDRDLRQHARHMHWCFDVFAHEPAVDVTLWQDALIATPHIAGHTLQAKLRATDMLFKAAVSDGLLPALEDDPLFPEVAVELPQGVLDWQRLVLALVDPYKMTKLWKKTAPLDPGGCFDALRKTLGGRFEFPFVIVNAVTLREEDRAILQAIGVQL